MEAAAAMLAGLSAPVEAVAESFAMQSPADVASVRVPRESRQYVGLEVISDTPAFLVTAEAHYPGWNARIDGIAAEIHYTNAAFRGLPAPPGNIG